MIYAFAFLLAAASVLVSALGHGDLGLVLAISATIAAAGGYLEERAGRDRRDARRRNDD